MVSGGFSFALLRRRPGRAGLGGIGDIRKMAERISLRRMRKQQKGIITAVKVGGELGRRIRDMGLVTGTEIVIQGRAPLNDPVALRIRGNTLTLRNNEADFIEVEVEDDGE